MQRQTIPLNSHDMTDLKEGDIIYTIEFIKEDDSAQLKCKEFLFKKYVTAKEDVHIEGLDINQDSVLAEIKDVKFDKIELKADIGVGFFKSKEAAAEAFMESIEAVYNEVKKAYQDFDVNLE
jgi:hypothetical protein